MPKQQKKIEYNITQNLLCTSKIQHKDSHRRRKRRDAPRGRSRWVQRNSSSGSWRTTESPGYSSSLYPRERSRVFADITDRRRNHNIIVSLKYLFETISSLCSLLLCGGGGGGGGGHEPTHFLLTVLRRTSVTVKRCVLVS